LIPVIEDPKQLRALRDEARKEGATVGFVPTMGALHEGHLSLARASKAATRRTLVSIFVNPLQFGPAEDFDRYPRDLPGDLRLLESLGVDAVFAPSRHVLYPPSFSTYVEQEGTTDSLCGASRPGHFRGVTTVVTKLFHLVEPDVAFFGQKDAQQAAIIRRMARDLSMRVEVRIEPTVREPDGLALSSRNRFLSPEERAQATALHRGLTRAAAAFAAGERRASALADAARDVIAAAQLARIDYVSVVHPATLRPIETVDDSGLLAVAVFFGKTRLIDNTLLPAFAPLSLLGAAE
jgi:pantoate--beta-alanine ligase